MLDGHRYCRFVRYELHSHAVEFGLDEALKTNMLQYLQTLAIRIEREQIAFQSYLQEVLKE